VIYDDERNWTQALFYLEQAAKQGLPQALYRFGLLQLEGRGTPANCLQALYNMQQAADKGHKEGQFRTGLLYGCEYMNGGYCYWNLSRSLHYLRQASNQNHRKAQAFLASLDQRFQGMKPYLDEFQRYEATIQTQSTQSPPSSTQIEDLEEEQSVYF